MISREKASLHEQPKPVLKEPEPITKPVERVTTVKDLDTGEPDYVPDYIAPVEPVTMEKPAQIAVDTGTAMDRDAEIAIKQQVESLLQVGKLHLETGEVGMAEQNLLKALELEPDNEVVRTYLEYCRKYHEIKEQRDQELQLIKAMIEIIGEDIPVPANDAQDTISVQETVGEQELPGDV